jgi:hypothetical protein
LAIKKLQLNATMNVHSNMYKDFVSFG